jgi:hypothetical protein
MGGPGDQRTAGGGVLQPQGLTPAGMSGRGFRWWAPPITTRQPDEALALAGALLWAHIGSGQGDGGRLGGAEGREDGSGGVNGTGGHGAGAAALASATQCNKRLPDRPKTYTHWSHNSSAWASTVCTAVSWRSGG